MALEIVQTGYKNSLYLYSVGKFAESECSYSEWLAELTTELELALEGSMEENVSDSEESEENQSDDDASESYSARKKEWEDILEQEKVVGAMLRQMMENGPGQQQEERPAPQKQKEEEPDNEFSTEGISMMAEGKNRTDLIPLGSAGNSKVLQSESGHGAEYFSPSNGGRQKKPYSRVICLTCETECDRKKQWKVIK